MHHGMLSIDYESETVPGIEPQLALRSFSVAFPDPIEVLETY